MVGWEARRRISSQHKVDCLSSSLQQSILVAGMQSSASPSHPLRPYYVPQQSNTSSSSTLPTPTLSSTNNPAHSLPTQPSPNRYESSLATLHDLPPTPSTGAMLKAFATSSLLSFTATALVMPFEVGKTLAQVQWVPRDGLDPLVWGDGIVEGTELQEEDTEEAIEVSFNSIHRSRVTGHPQPISKTQSNPFSLLALLHSWKTKRKQKPTSRIFKTAPRTRFDLQEVTANTLSAPFRRRAT